MSAVKRRELAFETFDQVFAEVERLKTVGCQSAGKWDFAQTLDHLATVMKGSLAGFPVKAPWIVRKIVGPLRKRRLFRTGKIGRMRLPEKFAPKPGKDLERTYRTFTKSLKMISEHDGDFQPHPFLGELAADEWRRFHLIHCAHHFSFLIPNS